MKGGIFGKLGIAKKEEYWYNKRKRDGLHLCERKNNMRLIYAHTDITQVPDEVFNTPNVTDISLAYTNITHIPEKIGELGELKCLYLTGLRLDTFPRSLLEKGLEIKNTGDHNHHGIVCASDVTVEDIPSEIFNQGIQAIKRHYAQLDKERDSGIIFKLNEAKVIIVGSGNAGKTSVIKALTNVDYDPKEPATIGLEIKKKIIQVNRSNFTLNIWDFGGQSVYQATQTMFMTPKTLYIIILDGRSEDSPDFWLQYITTLAAHSPILIVINKCDQNENAMINSRAYFYQYPMLYPEILRFSSVENKKELLDLLENKIGQIISSEEYKNCFQHSWSKAWASIKEMLQNLDEDYIEYSDFCERCKLFGVSDEADQKIIVEACHNLGIAFFYNHRIMKPEWLVMGANFLLSLPKHYIVDGWIELSDFYSYARSRGYLNGKNWRMDVDCIIGLLEDNELVYKERDKILIPSLLPEKYKNDLPLGYKDWQKFCVRYSFLPPALIQKFMVRNQSQQIKEIWRYGLYWKTSSNVECVMEYYKNDIMLHLKGSDADITAERYRLHSEFVYINHQLNIASAEFILIFCNRKGDSAEYSYEKLRKLREMKHKTLPLPEIGMILDVRKFAGYFPDNYESPATINQIERVDHMSFDSIRTTVKGKNNQTSVATGQSTASATQSFGGSNSDLQALIAAIEKVIPQGLSANEAQTTKDSLDVIQEEMAKPEPRKGFVRTALSGLKGIKATTEFAAAVTALYVFLKPIIGLP